MKLIKGLARLALGMGMLSMGFNTFAAADSVVGNWQTRDDKTRKPNSIITIWRSQKNTYLGKISKIYPVNGVVKKDVCKKCKGKQYNKPMLGLVIIQNMVFKQGKYVGGTILDPRNGKVYHSTLQVSPDNKTLKVRGYVGMPLFGQTKVWYRIPSVRN